MNLRLKLQKSDVLHKFCRQKIYLVHQQRLRGDFFFKGNSECLSFCLHSFHKGYFISLHVSTDIFKSGKTTCLSIQTYAAPL